MPDKPQLPAPLSNSAPTLPQTNALAEASPESLSELMSRDPEKFSQRDRALVVAAFREQRKRFVAAEAAGQKAPRQSKTVDIKTLVSTKTPGELGL